MPVSVRMIEEAPKVGRKTRSPRHPFSLRTRPWQIQPFFIAPVLPGETLKNLLLQARVVTKPIKPKLLGWWNEYYFFYVKHRDLSAQSADLQAMHVTNTALPAGMRDTADNLKMYNYNGGVKYTEYCLQRVVEEYFRDEEDGAWNSKVLDGVPLAYVNHVTGLESLRDQTDAAPANNHEMPGEVSELPFGVPVAFAAQYAQYEAMRALKMTTATFEDFLRQHGVSTPEVNEEMNRPELVRYIREFSYPTNTVEPTTGVPSSAVTWSVAERADKDRYIREPGFLFGVTVCRPKVYFSKQKGGLVGTMDDAFTWLPPAATDWGWSTVRNIAFNAGPLAGADTAGGYWLDIRDLLVYGDQFANYAMTASDGAISLPDAAFATRYATAADADALFVTPGTANFIEQDGLVSLSILGRVSNLT